MNAAQIITVLVFCTVYLYLVFRNRYMATALWIGVLSLMFASVVFGLGSIVSFLDLFAVDTQTVGESVSLRWRSINWNVIGIMVGTLLLAEVFIYSRAPAVLSDWLIDKSPNVCWAILGVCAISSFISIFAANVATVLIVAPIAIELARKLKTSPAPFLIGIAIASNLQGTATLIGDPPSMLIAAQYKMNFNDFFWNNGRPGIFFAVQIGAVASFGVLWLMFRKYKAPVVQMPVPKPRSWFPTTLMCLMVVGLALGSVFDPDFLWFGGSVCMVFGAVSIGWLWLRDEREEGATTAAPERPAPARGVGARLLAAARALAARWAPGLQEQSHGYDDCAGDRDAAVRILKSFDWSSTFFLLGVFAMVWAMVNTGVVEMAADWVTGIVSGSALLAFVIVVAFSTCLSAFVDNIPYIAVMLPLVMQLETGAPGIEPLGRNMVLAYGLLIGSCLGGNITPIGASANVVAYGMLNKMGERTTFWDFIKIGLPFTLAATAAGSVFVWLVCMW